MGADQNAGLCFGLGGWGGGEGAERDAPAEVCGRAHLCDTLSKIAKGHPISRVNELRAWQPPTLS